MPDFARRIIGGLLGVLAAIGLMYALGWFGVFPVAAFAAIGIGMGLGGTYRSVPWTIGAVAASATGGLINGFMMWTPFQGTEKTVGNFLQLLPQMPGGFLLGLILTIVIAAIYGGGSGQRAPTPSSGGSNPPA